MTPEARQHLLELFQAAFALARIDGLLPPIDLMHFGLLLRKVEPGFSHQTYGHEKLLYLLRDFLDQLHIRKDADVTPPKYYVDFRRDSINAKPTNKATKSHSVLKILQPLLVDSSLIDLYLKNLADDAVQIKSKLDQHELCFESIKKELSQSNALIQTYDERIAAIAKELEKSKSNEKKVNDALKKLQESIGQPEGGLETKPSAVKLIKKSGAGENIKAVAVVLSHSLEYFVKWRFKQGERVRKGQVICEGLIYKKSNVAFTKFGAPCDGYISEICYKTGEGLIGKNTVGHFAPE